MAAVPIVQSASLAKEMVNRARTEGVAIPEFLRRHRERYAKDLPEPRAGLEPREQKRILSFIYACMFAYFGHPDSVFKIAAPEEVAP